MGSEVESIRETVYQIERARINRSRKIAHYVFARVILGLIVFAVVVYLISIL